MNLSGRLLRAGLAGLALLASSHLASASPLLGPSRSQNYLTIGNDRGGYVIQYALRMLILKEAHRPVRFTGRCDSACTLYLGLPSNQTCVAPRAVFRFHAPYGAGAKGDRVALTYMLNAYPGWVKSWIKRQGGLSRRLISMDFAYASRFMRVCGSQTVELSKEPGKS